MNTTDDTLIYGRNAVLEFIKSDRPADQLYIQAGLPAHGSISPIIAAAKGRGLPIKELPRERLDALCGVAHQGVALSAAVANYVQLEDILAIAGDRPPFIVLADDIQDPHNLGAIIRTADAAGAHGVVIPKRGGVGLTPTVLKASAGVAAYFPVARVPNMAACVDKLKKSGVWCYCAHMEGTPFNRQDFAGPVALVVGSEGQGVSRLVREKCDFSVSIPMMGRGSSLNASVAAGIILYEIAKSRFAS